MAHRSDFDKFYNFMVVAGVVIMLANIYYYAHPYWRGQGWTHEIADTLMLKLRSGGVFSAAWKSKSVGMLLLAATLLTRSGKGRKMPWWAIASSLGVGLCVFLLAPTNGTLSYAVMTVSGSALLCWGFGMIGRSIHAFHEITNERLESFAQCEERIDTPDSINFKTQYFYKGRWRDGWVNCIAPTRGSIVMGVPGSGKSFSIIEQMIEQMLEKRNTMFVYDFKYPALTEVVYNELRFNQWRYDVKPQFCVINFNDPRYSLCCNPLDPAFITDPSDTSEIAELVMLNVNKNAVEKEDFFSMSAKLFLDAVIWYLRNHEGGKYCTFAHAIQFMSEDYKKTFMIMSSSNIPGLAAKIKSFVNAMEGNAQDQLQGQIASAQIPLGRFISPQIYWVLSHNDFPLDINNPEHPTILCVGNDPQRQSIYGTTLALIASRLFRAVNVPGRIPCGIIIDEFPTVGFKNVDTIIDTGRSNGLKVCLGFQDISQLICGYGENEAEVILNTVGNVFSGQVNGDTAEGLSKMFGKEFRKRESISRGMESDTVNTSFQQEELLQRSTIETLTQGVFMGKVADTISHPMDKKLFCGKIIRDMKEYKRKRAEYEPLPKMTDFGEEEIRGKIMENPADALKEYFKKQIREDGSIVYADDELDAASSQKAEQRMKEDGLQELLSKIAEGKIKAMIDEKIQKNYERIQKEISDLVERESRRSMQRVNPSPVAPTQPSTPVSPEMVDPFA